MKQLAKTGWTEVSRIVEAQSAPPNAYIEYAYVAHVRGGFFISECAWESFLVRHGMGSRTKRLTKSISAIAECCRECGWLLPFENVAIVSDRPRNIVQDDSANAQVVRVEYRDGFTVTTRGEV